MIGIFFASGSAIYFLMTLKCEVNSTCYTLFGIPIINISIAEKTNLSKTEIVNMGTSIAIFLIVVYLKTMINEDIQLLINKKLCPSLFTVMLQNVPAIDDQTLREWIEKCFGEKPVCISWAYNVEELQYTYKDKQRLTIELNKINIKMRKFNEMEAQNPNSILNEIKRDEESTGEL